MKLEKNPSSSGQDAVGILGIERFSNEVSVFFHPSLFSSRKMKNLSPRKMTAHTTEETQLKEQGMVLPSICGSSPPRSELHQILFFSVIGNKLTVVSMPQPQPHLHGLNKLFTQLLHKGPQANRTLVFNDARLIKTHAVSFSNS